MKSEINVDMFVLVVFKKFVFINLVNWLYLVWEYFGLMVVYMKNWLEGYRFECEFWFVVDWIYYFLFELLGLIFMIFMYIIIG